MILQRQPANDGAAIDLTPIIDMVFMLLIFFLAATSIQRAERETKIALPFTQTAGPVTQALREIVINIDAQGNAMVTGKVLDDAAIAAMLDTAVKANPDQKVSVRGDRAVAYAHVARVLDLCKRHGIQQPYLESIPLSPKT